MLLSYRKHRAFCQVVKDLKRLRNMKYSKIDIISGLKNMGYTEEEALHCYNVIEEEKLNKSQSNSDQETD